MRTVVALIAFVLVGCALFIPDYHAKRVINHPEPPQVLVRMAPHGQVCATSRDENHVLYVQVIVFVVLRGIPPSPATIVVDNTKRVDFADPRPYFVLSWKAGVGLHKVEVQVGDRRAVRLLTVFTCGEAGVQIA